MLKLNFIKVSPTENMTVFITDPVPMSMHSEISKKIMNYNNVYAEQVGFIEKTAFDRVRLQMMGGEFCGNAARALACVLVLKNHPSIDKIDDKFIVPLEVSGSDNVHHCEVIPSDGNHNFISNIKMPLHTHIEELSINYSSTIYKCSLVHFPGIVHLIVNDENIISKQDFFIAAKSKLNYLNYEALGIMFFNEKTSFLTPLVYVKATDSVVWERSCGSGTSAIGAYLSYKYKKTANVIVKQPGGNLKVISEWNQNEVIKIILSGKVSIVSEGILYLD